MIQKNRFLLAGLPVIALVWGMMVVGCDNGSTEDGGKYPTELIGKWYTSTNAVMLEFTSAGKFFYAGMRSYDASVSGKTISINFDGLPLGSFDYAIAGNKMIISNASGTFGENIAAASPLTKK